MSKYLVDTQILIWSLISPSKLSSEVIERLSTASICVSKISLWEIAIIQKLGKLPEFLIKVDELEKVILKAGFQMISLETKHILGYDSLPLFPDHRDPFDRLLLATAYSEKISIISADENFKLYQDWVDLVKM